MSKLHKTYIERVSLAEKNITDLILFERFMKILAARTGQEFNEAFFIVTYQT